MKGTQTLTVAEYGPEDVPEHLANYADGEGMKLRQITWQDRAKSFGRLIDKARQELNDAGTQTFF